MFEYELLIIRVLLLNNLVNLLRFRIVEFIELNIVLNGFLFDIFQGIESIHERKHGLRVVLRITDINFYKKC